ncbi:wall-associated receptor kinase 2 [Ziziphus jujuba]|uniref:Wall-associated receptor kinase 2 n=1 Tax=Ziziphus jujuba TaxID=326968 RepID=A0ABM3IPL0_ZIZJJ|nr:wall-associated receptor kinase 2 [Ziziphus jujuba]
MLPLVVDWAIGDEKCKEAEKRSNFSCKGNSSCVEPSKDSAAFDFGRRLPLNQGNPYVDDGCQDIDECEIRKIGKCRNLPENWSSHCLAGYVRTETGCSKLHGSRLGKSFLRHAAHVYEFIQNGSLSQHFLNNGQESLLSREMRLRIALQVAQALAYMHSEASMPIIYGNVNLSNILLDNNYMAKLDCEVPYLNNIVDHESSIRSSGYIDPEYLHSGKITEKSDVYSFGVVLKVLLTGKKMPVPLDEPNDERNLTTLCNCSMDDDDQLEQVLYDSIGKEENIEALKEVFYLAKVCSSNEGNERPTMTEVAVKLETLRNMCRNATTSET